jgi:hypothetical protein
MSTIALLYLFLFFLLMPVSLVLWLIGRRGGNWKRLGISGLFAFVGGVVAGIFTSEVNPIFRQLLDLWTHVLTLILSGVGLTPIVTSLSGFFGSALVVFVMLAASGLAGWLGWWLTRKNDN